MQIVFLDLTSVDTGDLGQSCLQQAAGQCHEIAWASRQARQRLLQEVAANILALQQGQRRHVVTG